jgi:hypothetical protein
VTEPHAKVAIHEYFHILQQGGLNVHITARAGLGRLRLA